jgi:hypothetical protein
LSPHSANIDRAKVEQQCGGILARLQPVYARGKEFWKRILKCWRFAKEGQAVDPLWSSGYSFSVNLLD